MSKGDSKNEDLVLQGLQWAAEQAQRSEGGTFDKLSNEFKRVQEAFDSGELEDEQAEKYGEALVIAVLAAGLASKNLKTIALMTILQSSGAAKWGGKAVAKALRNGFRYGPSAKVKTAEAVGWLEEQTSKARKFYKEHRQEADSNKAIGAPLVESEVSIVKKKTD